MLSARGLLGVAAGLVIFAQPTPTGGAMPAEEGTLVRVVDGDTVDVEVQGRAERVRLIGLDTPETRHPRRPVECFGREATAKAESLLPPGLPLELESDPTQGNRDKYGRLLRYVWLPDGRNVAEVMIAEGYGFEYTYALPYRHMDGFKAAQREARAAERGLWAPNTCDGKPVPPRGPPRRADPDAFAAAAAHPCASGQVKGNRNSGIYHAPDQRHYPRTRANVECFDSEGEAVAAGFRRAKR
jgi:micrococcal nuclease